MKKILITGANGGLGTVLRERLSREYEIIATDHTTMDITSEKSIETVLGMYMPEIIIHCAAIVNADQAQNNKPLTYMTNVKGTEYIVKFCKKHDIALVFFSSDYVFNGNSDHPYTETDLVEPIQYYGITKILGEQLVRDLLPRHLIIRVSWLFGPSGNTFFHKMLRLRGNPTVNVVDDQIGSPTYTPHIANAVAELLRLGKWGETYHITNEGSCSWAEYAEEIFRQAGCKTQVNHVDSSTYITSAKRPRYSCLSKAKAYADGLPMMPNWKDALKECFEALKENGCI